MMQRFDARYIDEVAREGVAILDDFLDADTVESLIESLAIERLSSRASQRAGVTFGIRDLLNEVPPTRNLANSALLKSVVEPIVGSNPRVVRALYFDKHKLANWKVAWHQDLTIAVRRKIDLEGFGPWSIKAGVTHVQPPASVLKNIVALRLHLDDADEHNGALRVIPGTHLHGRLDQTGIQFWNKQRIVTCSIRAGGVVVMRPLLLHSSQPARSPEHRRVLHFEYASIDLPHPLEWYE